MTNLGRRATRGVRPWGVACLVLAVACSTDGGHRGETDGGMSLGGDGSLGESGGLPEGGGGSAGTVLDGGSDGAVGSGGPTKEAFWSDFAGALCRHYFKCYDEHHGSEALRALTTLEECEVHLLGQGSARRSGGQSDLSSRVRRRCT